METQLQVLRLSTSKRIRDWLPTSVTVFRREAAAGSPGLKDGWRCAAATIKVRATASNGSSTAGRLGCLGGTGVWSLVDSGSRRLTRSA